MVYVAVRFGILRECLKGSKLFNDTRGECGRLTRKIASKEVSENGVYIGPSRLFQLTNEKWTPNGVVR